MIIFVNGAFDILHTGHIDLLNYAKSLGDRLVVAIDSDERIRHNKGKDRPINNVNVRKKILENIKAVDEVHVFNTDTELKSLFRMADKRVIGSDWKGKEIVGEDLIGIEFYDRVNDESTTKTIENFINRRKLL